MSEPTIRRTVQLLLMRLKLERDCLLGAFRATETEARNESYAIAP
jgi:hypothetical protein